MGRFSLTSARACVHVSFVSCPAASASLADRFALVLDGLCRVLAVRGSRDRAATALMLLLWSRLRRTVQRFVDLAGRYRAGTLRAPRPYSPAPGRRPPPPGPLLPRRFGWLVARVPEAAIYGEYLRQMLADPEMASLLEAAPQASRLLRPLCRMLAVRPIPALKREAPARMAPALERKVAAVPRDSECNASPEPAAMPPAASSPREALRPAHGRCASRRVSA